MNQVGDVNQSGAGTVDTRPSTFAPYSMTRLWTVKFEQLGEWFARYRRTFEALHRKGDATCPRSRLYIHMK